MKMPFIGWGDDPGAIVGFEVEQMILPRLSGPHVPRFIAAAFSDHPYLVMERIQGSSLKALVADLPRPPEEVAAIGAQGRLRPARHPPAACDPLRREAEQRDDAGQRRSGPHRLRIVATRAAARPAGRGDTPAGRHGRLYRTRAGARRPQRSSKRSLRAWRAALRLPDGRAALRRADDHRRNAHPPLSRPRASARAAAGLPAMAAGGRLALPRGGPAPPLPNRAPSSRSIWNTPSRSG